MAEGDEDDGGGEEGGADAKGFQVRRAWGAEGEESARDHNDEGDAEGPELAGRGGHERLRLRRVEEENRDDDEHDD